MTEVALSAEAIESLANAPAIYLLWPREGKPHLARTNVLRRRLQRILRTVGDALLRIEYQHTGSRLESQFLLRDLARRHLGADYRRLIRLRLPPYLKLVLSNPFPRTQVTTHIGRSPGVYFGPFRNRSTAGRFESEFLDLFQLRRCQDDLAPAADHPGCMYGEMGRCLRPCQQAVGLEEYRGEAARVAGFLRSFGGSLTEPATAARDRLSGEMDFEGAAMMHQRLGRIQEVLGLADEMAREINRLHAITITPAARPEAVDLGFLRAGIWRGFRTMEFALADGQTTPLDGRLREVAASVDSVEPGEPAPPGPVERMEHLAILSRWFYSSWCDGEMLLFDDPEKIPWRKLVNAVSRVAKAQPKHRPSNRS